MTKPAVLTGLDVLVEDNFEQLRGKSVGVIANQASVDRNLRHIVDLLHECPHCKLLRVFAPEHGLRGTEQDMARVAHAVDARTGVQVVSLYGNTARSLYPSSEQLEGLDVVVIDLQDVGSRYYTYTQTMAYTVVAAKKANVHVMVLDRPNPLGGSAIEGAPLTASCQSFCGYAPVANRHGLTIGEFAKLVFLGFGEGENKVDGVQYPVEIIPLIDWDRSMYFDETGLPWVYPSPNMPTLETAIVYPGACLFEATEISEGRGTTRPFELLGATFVDSDAWIDATHACGIPLDGAVLRPCGFTPQFQKLAGRSCSGVQIHITDRDTFQPFRWGLAMLAGLAASHPEKFTWRRKAYEFVEDVPAIDLLYGSLNLRKSIDTKKSVATLLDEIESFETWYREAREPVLIY